MSLANIREKLAGKLKEIKGLSVSEQIPDVVILPMAVISLNTSNPVDYDTTAVNETWTYHFTIQVLINKGASVIIAQKGLDQYIDPTSDYCIKNYIEQVDFGTDADTIRLSGVVSYGMATYGNTDYVAAYFNVDIMASKEVT